MSRLRKKKPEPLRPIPAAKTADLRVATFIACDVEEDMVRIFHKFILLRAALATAQREGKL